MKIQIIFFAVLMVGGVFSSLNDLNASGSKEKKTLSDKHRQEILAVFDKNEKLHKAFFDYDKKEVESAAQDTLKAIEKITEPEIAKLLNFSKKTLKKIQASADRDTNNQNYHLVSMALIHLLKKYDIGDALKAYSCPMLKMQWVQNTQKLEEVHNPFSPEMPSCGSVQ